jgi:hypothetical protein
MGTQVCNRADDDFLCCCSHEKHNKRSFLTCLLHKAMFFTAARRGVRHPCASASCALRLHTRLRAAPAPRCTPATAKTCTFTNFLIYSIDSCFGSPTVCIPDSKRIRPCLHLCGWRAPWPPLVPDPAQCCCSATPPVGPGDIALPASPSMGDLFRGHLSRDGRPRAGGLGG